jgi:ABC-2 type transport system ATP-binding protein
MPGSPAVEVNELSHRYGSRIALDGISFSIQTGEIFSFLGPNGGGKTTLFRILSTLLAPAQGGVRILGFESPRQLQEIRRAIGVVFQAPSLDRKLTVLENLLHQGRLYAMSGKPLVERARSLLQRFDMADRSGDLVETLSGGQRRRVELAKGLLHSPRLLLLDEPSTGLDPGVRSRTWEYLRRVREQDGATIVLTTHLLEEADKSDRIAILDAGKIVALGEPESLRSSVGGDSITIQTRHADELAAAIRDRFECATTVVDGAVRLQQTDGAAWIPKLFDSFAARIDAITLGKPTLEDVFINRCGRRLDDAATGAAP